MTKRKNVDESSITSMISSYVGNKKNKSKNNNIIKRQEAFWNTVVESLILTEKDEAENKPKADNTKKRYLDLIQRVVATKLKNIKANDPQLWSQFRSMGEKEQLEFKKDIWNKYKEKEGDNLKDKIQKIGSGEEKNRTKSSSAPIKKQDAGNRINQQKRVEVIGNLAQKVVQHMVDLTRQGKPIPSNVATLSRGMLGFQLNDIGKAKLQSLASKEGPVPQSEIDGFVKRALENKSDGNVIDFANTKMGLYPGDFQDETEGKANKKGAPGNIDKSRGIGSRVKTLDAGENIKDVPYQRSDVSNTPVYRMFKDFDINDILKYYDYYKQNPEEIKRAKKSDLEIEPAVNIQDLMGNVEEPSLTSKIGSSSTSSILSKREQEEAREARKNQIAKSAGKDLDFKQSFDLEPKDVLRRLSDFDEVPEPGSVKDRLASGLADAISAGNRREKIRKEKEEREKNQNKNFGATSVEIKKPSPRTIAHLIRKMSLRNSDGKFVKLQNPEKINWKNDEEKDLATKIFSKLNPKRLGGGFEGNKDSESIFNLKNFIPDFISAEEEKAAANIPELERVKKYDKDVNSYLAAKRSSRDKEKMSLDPEVIAQKQEEENRKKEEMAKSILDRRRELEKERLSLSDKLGSIQDLDRNDEPVSVGALSGTKNVSPLQMKRKLIKQMGGGSAVQALKKRKKELDDLPSLDRLYTGQRTKDARISNESKSVPNKNSILELLFANEEEMKEVEGWHKAKPVKKMRMSPKDKKRK